MVQLYQQTVKARSARDGYFSGVFFDDIIAQAMTKSIPAAGQKINAAAAPTMSAMTRARVEKQE